MEDPNQRQQLLQDLKPYMHTIEDEHGESFKVIKFKDAVVYELLLTRMNGEYEGFKVNDLRRQSLRDDDILLCSYAKTGTVVNLSYV